MSYDHAEKAYKQAMSLGADCPDIVSVAALALGRLHRQRGDLARAERFFDRVVKIGQPGLGSLAALELGRVRVEQGNRKGARAAYVLAIEFDSKDPDVTPQALNGYAELVENEDLIAAGLAFRNVIMFDEPDQTRQAERDLRRLYHARPDLRSRLEDIESRSQPDALAIVKTKWPVPEEPVPEEPVPPELGKTIYGLPGKTGPEDGIDEPEHDHGL